MNVPAPEPRPGPFGIYFHIPFCLAKCPYCDFVSIPVGSSAFGRSPVRSSAFRRDPGNSRLKAELRTQEYDRILAALPRELELALAAHPDLRGRGLDSVYFGGGTPSLLPAEVVAELIRRTFAAFAPWLPVEVTLECNPISAEIERLAAYRDAGVTRISLGVQSFDPTILKALGRLHTADEAREAVWRTRSLHLDSWGLDLIFGAPGSSLDQWRDDLGKTIACAPPHISIYGLTLHEGTLMFDRHARGEIALPGDEEQRAMFLEARRTLTAAGWRHYEISNYARPGHESRHNRLYWTGGEYVGLGVAAHSYFGGRRYANPSALRDYLTAVESGRWPAVAEPVPSVRSGRGERIMLGLRQCGGFDPSELSAALGGGFVDEYHAEIRDLVQRGLLIATPGNVRLSEEGLLLSDLVFETFF